MGRNGCSEAFDSDAHFDAQKESERESKERKRGGHQIQFLSAILRSIFITSHCFCHNQLNQCLYMYIISPQAMYCSHVLHSHPIKSLARPLCWEFTSLHFPALSSIAPSSASNNNNSRSFLASWQVSHLILRSLCWSRDSFEKASDWFSAKYASGCTRGFNHT